MTDVLVSRENVIHREIMQHVAGLRSCFAPMTVFVISLLSIIRKQVRMGCEC